MTIRAQRTAGAATSANCNLPKRCTSFAQAATAPGTVTASQPNCGMASRPAKRSGVQAAGEGPEEFRPCNSDPSQTMAKASPPMPHPVGSTTVRAIAAATAASTALPPRISIAMPACDASGCEVAITSRQKIGERAEG